MHSLDDMFELRLQMELDVCDEYSATDGAQLRIITLQTS